LHAFEVIEPDTSACKAQIELHSPLIVLFQGLRLHWFLAVRAGQSYRGVLLQCNIPSGTKAGASGSMRDQLS